MNQERHRETHALPQELARLIAAVDHLEAAAARINASHPGEVARLQELQQTIADQLDDAIGRLRQVVRE